jgi:hypothetical protein
MTLPVTPNEHQAILGGSTGPFDDGRADRPDSLNEGRRLQSAGANKSNQTTRSIMIHNARTYHLRKQRSCGVATQDR